MIKVYVAGAYSADNVIDVLKNIGKGETEAANLFKLGFAVFTPWHDKDYIIKNPYQDWPVKHFLDNSMAWLEVSDIVYVIPGWENSTGVKAEIVRAKELRIPVVYEVDDLLEWKYLVERSND